MAVSIDSTVRVKIDSDTKRKASKALEKMGLSVSDAVRLMLVRVAEEERLPFEAKIPNAETRAAIEELEQGRGMRAATLADLMDDLNADD